MIKNYRLGDLGQIKGGKRLPKEFTLSNMVNEHPYIRVRDLLNKHLLLSNMEYVPEGAFEKISRYIVKTGDVVLSIVGSVGLVAVIDEPLNNASLTENCVKITVNAKVLNNEYLYYFLKSEKGQSEISSKIVGAVQPKLPIYNINSLEVPLPDLEKQQEIAEILSSLDDKIELNNKLNHELENLAQTIFKRWFVDFEFPDKNGNPYKSSGGKLVAINNTKIPEGWNTIQFKDLATVKYGKDHKNQGEGKYPVFGSGGLMRNIDNYLYDSPSILIPRKGTLTNIMRVLEPFWTVDTMFYTEIHNPRNLNYLYYYLIKENLSERNVGSAVPSLTAQIINSVSVILPNSEIIEKFEMLISDSLKLSQQNSKENSELLELRDLLIQKLIAKVV